MKRFLEGFDYYSKLLGNNNKKLFVVFGIILANMKWSIIINLKYVQTIFKPIFKKTLQIYTKMM